MKVYLLIHEQDTDSAWGCDVKIFLNWDAAHAAMRSSWEEAAKVWEYDQHDHRDEDESTCDINEAVIREDSEVERWRIEEQELDVCVAVKVEGGMVQEAIANTFVDLDVYDMDVSDFPDDGEEDEVDEKQDEYDRLSKTPGWRAVW